jgi:hypothetical protein
MNLPDPATVNRVACVGAGTIGAGWAALFLSQGLAVEACDPADGAEDRLRTLVARAWPSLEALGLAAGADPSKLSFKDDLEAALDGAQFVQESAPDHRDLKVELAERIDRHLPDDVVIAYGQSRSVVTYLINTYGEARMAELMSQLDHTFSLDQAMIQVEPGTVAPRETAVPPPELPETDLGDRYVEGEIVGSKCYLGVMNPGSGITHRACAAVCINGGIAPLLEVRREDGRREGIVLAGSGGEAIGDSLEGLIATPVGMTGRLVQRGGTTFLHVDPAAIRRLR